jgi:hypothetical protein
MRRKATVALCGLTPALLEWGSYLAGRNVEIVGLYDVDHRAALMASLRLACSAHPEPFETLAATDTVLMGKPVDFDWAGWGGTVISLGFEPPAGGLRLDGGPDDPHPSDSRIADWF